MPAKKFKKRAVVVNPLNTWWSFQITLEILYRYRELDYEVFWFNAAVRNKKKFEMNETDFVSRFFFKNPSEIIRRLLTDDGIHGKFDYIEIDSSNDALKHFEDIDELRNYKMKGAPLGAIIFSAIASKLKHTGFSLQEVTHYCDYYLNYTSELEKQFSNFLEEFKPDLVLTINDRLPGSSLSCALARANKIDAKVYYWGSSIDRIIDHKDSLYDFDEWRNLIQQKKTDKKISTSEEELFRKRISALSKNPSEDSKTFLSYQKKGQTVIKQGKLITFYSSSEHEHSPVLLKKRKRFDSQYDAFLVLQEICISNNFHLVLKYHPIKKSKFSKYLKISYSLHDWKKVQINPKVTQLFPDSQIDTYQLILDSDINITWSSTVGIESIMRGKPTLILGDTPWLDLNWNIHAWSKRDLEKLILEGPATLAPDALLTWYWFLQDYGEHFKYVLLDTYNPKVKDTYILQPRWFFWIFYKLIVSIRKRKFVK